MCLSKFKMQIVLQKKLFIYLFIVLILNFTNRIKLLNSLCEHRNTLISTKIIVFKIYIIVQC